MNQAKSQNIFVVLESRDPALRWDFIEYFESFVLAF